MYCNMHRLVLLLPLFATTNAESVCQFAGIYVDNTEIGQSNPSAGATLSITGDIFNFINFTDTFPNNSSKVAIIEHTNGWYELEYPTIGCGLAKINSGEIELTKPLPNGCATEWPTADVAFSGSAIDGSQTFCDLWIFGVFGALIGTFLSTLGLGLQKLTHEKLKAEGKEIENYCHHPTWLAGIGCLVIDAVLDVWTFGLAPASLLAPMASMVLVWNVVTAPCLVGEKVTKRGLLGTAVIITGSICATIFSQHDTPNYSLDDFAQRWSSPEVIIYEILVITIFIAHKIGLRQMQIQNSKQFVGDGDDNDTDHFDDPATMDADVDAIDEKQIDSMTLNYEEGSKPYLIAQFVMAMVSGMLGGQSIIFAKTVVELLKATFFPAEGSDMTYNAFASFPFYIFLGCLICVLMTQTQVLNVAMHNFDSLNVIPIFITFYQVFGVIGGAIYYQEFNDFSVEQAFMFPIGCSISFVGIYILSKAPEENDMAMERMVDEDEESSSSTSNVTKNGTRASPALTSGGTAMSPRERYRSRFSSVAAGPMLSFTMSSTILDRDGISESIKQRRRSIKNRKTSQSMRVADGDQNSAPKRMSTV